MTGLVCPLFKRNHIKKISLSFALVYILIPYLALSQDKVAEVKVKENFWYKKQRDI